ncbi:TIGR00730 family Rossman fold protein [Salinigranum rubrum]|uniref:TIGR00730 family Rossman fold protein n=1 Tax=Salinigranum rubrum TaxID=755307 RepID=A0A2I8VNU8_9EURY|nr:TIGR00730 family Rossman fold protein [Salinigranum rubrum]AUV83607.1 TIGR00730 family Rossman fold protein [Salinigranum rubrum]
MERICVYCGSRPGTDPAFVDAARAFGRLLAERDLGLVYGGGDVGLMGAVADSALAAGGEVIGVIPEALFEREVAHEGVTDLHVVDSMHTRKRRMADLADGFVALPGGFGTLEELVEMLTWAQLGFHTDPCGLLNVSGYYDGLVSFFDAQVDAGFVEPRHRELLVVTDDPTGLLDRFAAYESPVREQVVDDTEL